METKEFKVGQIWKMRNSHAGNALIVSTTETGAYPVRAVELNGGDTNTHTKDGRYNFNMSETGFDLIELVSETGADSVDTVNHPAHYTSHPSGVECIQITEHMGFNLGNAFKYIWRADLKADAIEDLRKAAWYLQREIDKREASF